MNSNIRAGRVDELVKPREGKTTRDDLPWVIVDIGFSGGSRSCGININGSEIPDPTNGYRASSQGPTKIGEKHYGMLCPSITHWLNPDPGSTRYPALNLMIEALLSMAFSWRGGRGGEPAAATQGNPIARIPDRLEDTGSGGRKQIQQRLWYTQPAAGLMIASMKLIQELSSALEDCEIRLFEGFVSFKTGGKTAGHYGDTRKLWEALPERGMCLQQSTGQVVDPKCGIASSILELMGGTTNNDIPPVLRVADPGGATIFAQ